MTDKTPERRGPKGKYVLDSKLFQYTREVVLDMKQDQLAHEADVSPTRVVDLESGRGATMWTILKLAYVLKLSPEELKVVPEASFKEATLGIKTHVFLVPPRIAGFIGRTVEHERLSDILLGEARRGAPRRAAVWGTGGNGKSCLVTEYAHELSGHFSGIAMLHAQTTSDLIHELAALAVEFGVASKRDPDMRKNAKKALRHISDVEPNFLLIFDDVENPDAIKKLLPWGNACLIVTSKFPDWAGWAEHIPLSVLPFEQALELLETRASRGGDPGATRLVTVLDRLPLALDHAGAYCRQTGKGFAACADRIEDLVRKAPVGTDYSRSIYATFKLAIEAASGEEITSDGQSISESRSDAANIIYFLGFCAPTNIPVPFLNGVVDSVESRDDALTALMSLSLIQRSLVRDVPAVLVHSVVQAVARMRATETGTAESLKEMLAERLWADFPKDYRNPRRWLKCAVLAPHAVALAATWSQASPMAKLLGAVGGFFQVRGDYLQAQSLFEYELRIAEKNYPPNDIRTAAIFHKLGHTLNVEGEYWFARKLFQKAIDIRVADPNCNEGLIVDSRLGLAEALSGMGALDEAKEIYDNAFETAEFDNPTGLAQTLYGYASILIDLGEFAKARDALTRAIKLTENLEPLYLFLPVTIGLLGSTLAAEGNFKQAKEVLERAKVLSERIDRDNTRLAFILSALADVNWNLGEHEESEALLERSVRIYRAVAGDRNLSTAAAMHRLARILHDKRNFRRALELIKPAYEARRILLGIHDPNTISSQELCQKCRKALDDQAANQE